MNADSRRQRGLRRTWTAALKMRAAEAGAFTRECPPASAAAPGQECQKLRNGTALGRDSGQVLKTSPPAIHTLRTSRPSESCTMSARAPLAKRPWE